MRLPTTAAAGLLVVLAGCSYEDSKVAISAQHRMIGMSESDVATCLGAPDQHMTFGDIDILTYYTTSSSAANFTLPIVQGPSYSNGGNCHMTVRFDDGRASRILYSGEKNATGAPSAYCAPIVRTCLATLDELRKEKGAVYR